MLDDKALAERIRHLNEAPTAEEKSARMMELFPHLLSCLTVQHALRDPASAKAVFEFVRLTASKSLGHRAFAPELLVLFTALAIEPALHDVAQRAVSAATSLLVDAPEHDLSPETLRAFVEDAVVLLDDVSQLCGACGTHAGAWLPSDALAAAPTLVLAFERLAAQPPRRGRAAARAARLPFMLDVSSLERAFRAALFLLPLLAALLQRLPAVVADLLGSAQAWGVSAFFASRAPAPAPVREAALVLLEAQLRTAPVPPAHADPLAGALLAYLSVPAHDAARRAEADLVAARCLRLLFTGAALAPASLHALQATLPRLLPDNAGAPLELHVALVDALAVAVPHSADLAAALPRHLRPLFGPPPLQPALVACLRAAVAPRDDYGKAPAKRARSDGDSGAEWAPQLEALLADVERPDGAPRDWSKLLLGPDAASAAAVLAALVAVAPPRAALRKLRGPLHAAVVGAAKSSLSAAGGDAMAMLLEAFAALALAADHHAALPDDMRSSLVSLASAAALHAHLAAAAPLLVAAAAPFVPDSAASVARLLTTAASDARLVAVLQHVPLFWARLPPPAKPPALRLILTALDERLAAAPASAALLDGLLTALAALACLAAGAEPPSAPTDAPRCWCTAADVVRRPGLTPLPPAFERVLGLVSDALSTLPALPPVPCAARLLTHVDVAHAEPLVALYARRHALLALAPPADVPRLAEWYARLAALAPAAAGAWLGRGVEGAALGAAVERLYVLQFTGDDHAGGRAYDALRALRRAHGVSRLCVFLFSFAPLLAPSIARDPRLLSADASVSLFDCTPREFFHRTLCLTLPALLADADDPASPDARLAEARIVALAAYAGRPLKAALLCHAPDILARLLPRHCGPGGVLRKPLPPSLALLARLSEQAVERLTELRASSLSEPDPPLLALQLLMAMGRPEPGPALAARHALEFMAAHHAASHGEAAEGEAEAEAVASMLRRDFFHMMLQLYTLLAPSEVEGKRGVDWARLLQTQLFPPTDVLAALEQLVALLSADHAAAAATRVHLRAVLRCALHQPPLQRAALACWAAYVRRLPDARALGPQLAQLVVDVLPTLEPRAPPPVAAAALALLDALIARGADLAQLPFLLPALPALDALLARQPSPAPPLPALLVRLAASAQNEETDVRRAALTRVASVLAEAREAVRALVADGKGVAEPVARLLEALFAGARDEDSDSRECAIAALGTLGAIEPSRVEGRVVLRAAARAHGELEEVAKELLSGPLLKGLVAHATMQARTAATIQQLLADVLHVPKERPERSAHWTGLAEGVRHLVAPYLTTRYFYADRAPAAPAAPDAPAIARAPSYRAWLTEWASRLITALGRDAPALFRIVLPLTRKDQELAAAVLPTLALEVAQRPARHAPLVDELRAVLRAAHTDPPAPLAQRACETCFALLDHLARWLEARRAQQPTEPPAVSPSKRAKQQQRLRDQRPDDPPAAAVDAALAALPPLDVAAAARRCRAYPRALMQLEEHLRNEAARAARPADVAALPLPHAERVELQRVLGGLGDADALAGLAAVRGTAAAAAAEEAHDLENTGRWLDALQLYEAALSARLGAPHAERVALREGQARCLAALDQLNTLLAVVNDAATEPHALTDGLRAAGVEAAWRLGRWERLDALVSDPAARPTPDLCLGRALLALHRQQPAAVAAATADARRLLLEPLAAASVDSYVRAYPLLLQLHLLYDVELAASAPPAALASLLASRAALAPPNHATQERLLSVRAVLLAHRQRTAELGRTWLQLSKLARKAGNAPRASAALARARECAAEGVVLQEAKLLWASGSHARAMRLLEAEEARLAGGVAGVALGAVRLLSARWLQASGQRAPADVAAKFRAALAADGTEKAHFLLARYYDALLAVQRGGSRNLATRAPPAPLDAKQCQYLPEALAAYGEALKRGHKRLYHALPRMLTLWLDYMSAAAEQRKAGAKDAQRALDGLIASANRNAKAAMAELPPFVALMALPHLLSRLLHRHTDAADAIKAIVTACLHAHPHQTLWLLMASLIGMTKERVQRTKAILDEALRGGRGHTALHRQIDAYRKLGEALVELCNLPVPQRSRNFSVSHEARKLSAARAAAVAEQIILPLQSSLSPSLPPLDRPLAGHVPFGALPCVGRFQDNVEVLGSLQRPRKLHIEASDGRTYIFLCKPKDDLRRDARMMEFNVLVNKLLTEEAEARRRSLHIRTYGVVPLNEECGLIEWVPNTQPMRATILPLYGFPPDGPPELTKWIKAEMGANRRERSLVEVFVNSVLPVFSPCRFHRWFLNRWPEPNSWLEARQRYVRGTALMSMVGAVVGLGDRHGENILLDTQTGDTMHVDFNCLLWKGKTFQTPERVPFRLTQNMVDGMGVLGVEGPFRRTAEVVLGVLRANRDSLMSVLETFIHDPTLDHNARQGDERDTVVSALAEIERVISGRHEGVVLSVEGQVQQLIEEATSNENLAQMYIGWNAWV